MTNRDRVRIVVVLGLAGLAAAGCSSSGSGGSASSTLTPGSTSSAVNLSSVTLNVGDQKGTGSQALLTAAGLINKLPFKINWSDFASGPTMVQAMSTGAVDIGGVGDVPAVFAAAGGENVEIVGARETPFGDNDAIVVPKNSPIHSISQLRGKKIAVLFGTSPDYELLTVLAKNGLTTKDVSLANLEPAEALAAFTSGSIAAWDIWPPYSQQVVAQDGARILVTGPPYGSPYSFEVASKAAVDNPAKAAAIKVYLETLNKAYLWSDTHTIAWGKVWGAASGLPASIMDVAAKVDANVPARITSATIATEQNVANQFYEAGLIPTKVNMAAYVTAQFNDTVSGS